MAYVGSAPAAPAARRSAARWSWSCRGCRRRRCTRRPAITAAERRPSAAARAGRGAAASTYSGLSSRTAVETTTVSTSRDLRRRRGRGGRSRRARAARERRRVGAVAAADRDAAGEHDPGDAGQPGAADADEVHPAELARPAAARRGRAPSSAAAASSTIRGQLLVGVARDQAGRGGAHRGQPVGVGGERRARCAATQSEVRSASATRSAPPASTTGRALCACSPLPIGSGTKIAGSPTAAASVTLLAPARQTTRSAAA